MDGVDRMERRKSLAERLGFKGIGCCGANWGVRDSDISVMEDDDRSYDFDSGPPVIQNQADQQTEVVESGGVDPVPSSDPGCESEAPVVPGMNLADALAAERQFRSGDEGEDGSGLSPTRPDNVPETPLRVSLMRLLEEADGGDGEEVEEKTAVGSTANDSVCCVCMGRKKGSAFIPCGHTFCRVCSRELWLNRGTCPLCNRQIVEILDIF
ncbi:death-associated inhibitor of apoptosis 1-like [Heracleum sosnowskyi]|uniref:Death-associated inhibitor of apoptosis 1-like n=1 Tax=Heracleum sosnowskyi TaxID=360622 RepID=A0AAD8GQV9_9APIA|nr:death-associated inhibitor of apoptosis 1-like [Heracleum sosnowskyi]